MTAPVSKLEIEIIINHVMFELGWSRKKSKISRGRLAVCCCRGITWDCSQGLGSAQVPNQRSTTLTSGMDWT